MEKFRLRFFNIFFKATLGVWLRLSYNIVADLSKISHVKPPYILISNHCLNWDPFMLPLNIKEQVYWMASDNLFRSKILGFILTKLVGAFSKKKAVADMSSVKTSIRIVKKGGIVGLFPEGNRTWNGKTIDALYATAKFVKLLKVPVVMCEQRGGYLSRPRWAVRGRKGKVQLNYYQLLNKEQLKSDSVDEVYQAINQAISYNENEWQLENMIPFKGKANAEFLEQYLYVCPSCHSISSLHSEKHKFYCDKCDLSVILNDYGIFEGEKKPFDNVSQWGDWQNEFIRGYIKENKVIFKDLDVVMKTDNENGKLDKGIKGTLTLDHEKVYFESETGNMTFYHKTIFGNTIQLNWIFEFYYNGEFRRFYFYPKNRISAFKWNEVVDIMKEIGGKSNGK